MSVTILPPSGAHAAAGTCEVHYSTYADWGTGFVAGVTITNLGAPWPSYTVAFRFTGTQTITQVWGHAWTQTGQAVSVRSPSGAATVGTGQNVSLGFNAGYSGANNPPVNWSVNGVFCGGDEQQSPRVIVEPDAMQVPEGGGGSFTVRLSQPPTQAMALPRLSTSMSEGGRWAIAALQLVFTPDNWNVPKPFPFYNMTDTNSVNDTITFTVSLDGYAPDSVTVTQIDNG